MITGQRLLDSCLPGAVTVESESDVGEARRLAAASARSLGFGESQAGRVSIVATELATNLVKYAQSGRVLVRLVECEEASGVEILALDGGPGMHDADDRRVDGYSTGGTPGGGLGAIGRLSDQFDLYSVPGRGTVALARLWGARPPSPELPQFLVGAVAEAVPGEWVSGDAWAVEQRGSRIVALVADGLGHGVGAAEASRCAVETFRSAHREPAEAIVEEIHAALRATRGAAVAVAEVDADAGRARFCGVGNIASSLIGSPEPVRFLSQFGIAGLRIRPTKAVEAPWGPGSVLVMHSDGLSAKWTLDPYPGLDRHHPAVTAAIIMRDASRRPDDATVLTLRAALPAQPSGGNGRP